MANIRFLSWLVFIADMFAHEDGGPEPDWVRTEREQFSDFRDLNKDGKMDQDEIRQWVMPQDYDHAQAEARHLVYESDQDKVPHVHQHAQVLFSSLLAIKTLIT